MTARISDIEKDFADLCRALMLGKGRVMDARKEAEGCSTRVQSILAKADPGSVGGMSPEGWGGALVDYQLVAQSFVESLRHVGVFDSMVPAMRNVPLRTRLAVVSAATVGDGATEGESKPVCQLELANAQLEPFKATAVVVTSQELMRLGGEGARQLIVNELRGAVTAATDAMFVAGLDAMTPSSVSSSGSFLDDMRALMLAVKSGSGSRFYMIVTADDAKVVATMSGENGGVAFPGMTANGGVVAGVNVLASDHVTPGSAMLVDATQIAVSPGTVALDASQHATVTLAETDLTSLWQKNMVGLRAERFFGFEKLREDAVAVLSDVAWSGDSPA